MPILFKENEPLTRYNFTIRDYYEAFLYGEAMDIGGGIITKEEIDELDNYPQLTRISVAGLHQDTFDYFVEKYGKRFTGIYFFKNKMVADLSALETLTDIEVLGYFLNQRATKLWDMSKNKSLCMLNIDDFSRLDNLHGIEKAPELQCIKFGNKIWATSKINIVPDLSQSKLEYVSFNASLPYEETYKFLQIPNLKELDFRSNLYKTEFLAWVCANYPEIEGFCLRPYRIFQDNTGFICGKRKPSFYMEDPKGKKKAENAEKRFEKMKENYVGWSFDEIMKELEE